MKRQIVAGTILLLAIPLLTARKAVADDWSRFRGPNGTGVSSSHGLPVEFGPELGVVWVTEIPFGRSSPALADNRIFLTAVDGDVLVTLALARDSGELLWRREVERSRVDDLYEGTDSSSASPVTDGTNVYVFFHEVGLISYDRDGNERWRVPMGPFRNFYGIAASPVISGDTVFMVADQVTGSYLFAVDTATGKERWRQERPARLESYATPIFSPSAEAPAEILVLGSSWVDAYDLDSGEVKWSMTGVGAGPVASPTLSAGLLFVTAPDHASEPLPPFSEITQQYDADGDGELDREELAETWMFAHFGFLDVDDSGAVTVENYEFLQKELASDNWGVYCIRLSEDGSSRPEIVWNVRQSVPYIPSPLVYDGVLYIIKDTILTSLEPETGAVLKRGRLGKEKTSAKASPIGADGKVYLALTDGTVAVISAGADWEILAMNAMEDEVYATPAVSDRHLYIRTRSRLYSFADGSSTETGSPR